MTDMDREAATEIWGGLLARSAETGLVSTARVPDFAYGAEYFSTESGDWSEFASEAGQAIAAARFTDELDRLDHLGFSGSLLDIGCATGEYLQMAGERGWTLSGVEVADYARERASELAGVEVKASLEDLPAGRKYDLVTLHHVLEHIPNPTEFLRESVLPRVERHVLIEVPNFASLAARVEGPRWRDLRPEQHVSHFEPATLRRTVEEAGLQVLDVYTLRDPIWSITAALHTLSLLARAWPAPRHDVADLEAPDVTPPAAYFPPTGLKRLAVNASFVCMRPILEWFERTGRAERLVVEARPLAAEQVAS